MTDTILQQLATSWDTPCFVFDIDALRDRMREIKSIVGTQVELCYSIKANPFLIEAMQELVSHLEVCSPGELSICENLRDAGNHHIDKLITLLDNNIFAKLKK